MAASASGPWSGRPGFGPCWTCVRCAPGYNLMVHAAIYRGAAGRRHRGRGGDVDDDIAGFETCARYRPSGGPGCSSSWRPDLWTWPRPGSPRRFVVLARGVIPDPGGQGRAGRAPAGRCGSAAWTSCQATSSWATRRAWSSCRLPRRGGGPRAARARAEKDAATSSTCWEKAHRARDRRRRSARRASRADPIGRRPGRVVVAALCPPTGCGDRRGGPRQDWSPPAHGAPLRGAIYGVVDRRRPDRPPPARAG